MKNTIKKIGLLFATAVMIMLFAFSVSALEPTGQCGDSVFWNYNEETGELVISGEGDMTNYSYSDSNSSPFRGSDVMSVVIEDGVTSVGYCMFRDCKSLENVIISDSVTKISHYAFMGCSNLVSIKLSNSLTYIGADAFQNCSRIESITIPNEVLTIEHGAFSGCSSLISITIPDGVTKINYGTFSNCLKLISVTIPDSVSYIGENAFSFCESLTNITIPYGVKTISYQMFYYCRNLESVTISDRVTSIGKYAFQGCNSLKEINIPNSVTHIYDEAFKGCTSLSNITIPKNVAYIGEAVFEKCSDLENVYVDDENTYYADINGVLFNKEKTEIIRYPSKKAGNHYEIPSGVIKILKAAFEECDNLNSIMLPESVTEIFEDAFFHCSFLKTIYLPEGLTTIGSSAFYECRRLDNVKIPESVTRIGGAAFLWCSNLKSITIPNGVTTIEASTFYDCLSLETVIIPDSVTTIEGGAFEYCYKLKNLTLSNSLTRIGSSAFMYCEELTTIVIPDSVTEIGTGAFNSCEKLELITIGSSITKIGNSIFSSCDNIKHIGYKGTQEQWNSVTVGGNNDELINAPYFHYEFNPETDITEVVTPSTCHTEGAKAIVCSCGYVYSTETLPIVDCSFTAYESDNNATCLEDGTKTAYCDYGCGASDTVADEGSALGHDMGDFIVITASTCTEEGEERADCSRCDYFETRETAKVAHNHTPTKTLPTCTEGGYTTYTCICGDTYIADKTDALGHDLGIFVVTVIPTCITTGEERADCSRCDYSETRKITAENHKDENYDGYCDYCNEYIADKDCVCICHAKGIGALIYKLFKIIDSIFDTNLVRKVFKISDICLCGIKH